MENLRSTRSARCSPSVFSKVFAARKKNLSTARPRKNKHTAHMLANARKDHSIPLTGAPCSLFVSRQGHIAGITWECRERLVYSMYMQFLTKCKYPDFR